MPFESFVDVASASSWTYAAIIAIAALDALLPLVPSEATVISAGVLAGAGELSLALVIVAGAAGAFAGDSSAYWLGRRLDRQIAGLAFRGEAGRRRRLWAEGTLERHGGPVIFGARFVPGGRTATTVTAGAVRMRWLRFAAFAALAAVAWASYAALLGYLGGRAFEHNPLWGLVLGFGIAFLTFAAVEAGRRIRARRGRAKPDQAAGDAQPSRREAA
jgi:membrane protein DedA with SNARE-associated domain